MNVRSSALTILALISIASFTIPTSLAQTPAVPPSAASTPTPDQALYATSAAQDTLLFTAVNHCDLDTVTRMFSEDLEFYHDKNDPQFGRKLVVDAIHANLCGKVQRELVPGTLEVHPIQNYGAVEIGVHRFLHPGTNNPDKDVVGEAKFIHLWRLKDGHWQITRVISYDHALAR